MSTFEIQHFKNQELAKAYMQGVHDITEWLLKPNERTATNFDRITASPEALNKAFAEEDILNGRCIYTIPQKVCDRFRNCEECRLTWLKQEARDEDGV